MKSKENNEANNVILFTHIARSNYCGAESNIYRLIINIDRKRFEPVLLLQRENDLADKIRAAGLKVYILPFPDILDSYDKKLLSLNPLNIYSMMSSLFK